MGVIEVVLDKQVECVDEAEHRISVMEHDYNAMSQAQTKTDKTVTGLQAKVVDLEARCHRSNILVVVLAE
ncbi:hypothetical protein NDU88_001105 [Pleurodeles waltl]|uniref:Uncharacterized protein n=1 Tax=Pleurodeles waltl TaxID=8319 RepID=A0AAV7THC1_PLEWA|nr:hypothetical protein NDU88_001105 [Pleurodeles waltl]